MVSGELYKSLRPFVVFPNIESYRTLYYKGTIYTSETIVFLLGTVPTFSPQYQVTLKLLINEKIWYLTINFDEWEEVFQKYE